MAQYTAIIRSAPSTPPSPGADQNHSDTRHLPHYHKEGPAAMVHRTPVFRFALLTVGIVGMFLLLDGSQWAFSQFVSLPPYFRFLLLVNLGVWCWATNVHGLSVSGIDVARLMDDGTGNTHQHRRVGGGVDEETDDDDGDDKPSSGMDKFYIPIYGVAAGLTGVTIVSMLVFLKFAEKWGEERAEFVPALTYLLLVVLVCWPYKGFFAQERSAFRRSLKRIVVDGFGSAVPFCDVILADILTSFAKIVGDLQIVFADFVTNESISSTTVTSVLAAPNIAASRMTFQAFDFVSPLLICLPYLFRLRQCIAEYTQTPKPAVRRRHLANSLKYLSALPVVMSGFTINWMEARYHRRYGGGLLEGGKEDQEHSRVLESTRHGLNAAIGYWIFFSIVQSFFSLYWDVVMDWHLGNFRNCHKAGSPLLITSSPRGTTPSIKTSSTTMRYPIFLRPSLHFQQPSLYYAAIAIDTILRFSWIVRITLLWKVADSVGMSAATKSVSSVKEALVAIDIALKILEVLRRWMWVFLRVEREWVSRPSYAARGAHHLASGDAMSPMLDPPDLGWDRLRESTMLSSKLTR